ncbi:MAG: helix-turn-helix domain-containing protein [Pseudomonadota bacterium]
MIDTSHSGSAARTLTVLGLTLEFGPVTPARLTELSGLSRTAVHRAIHALIDEGFLRYQLGKAHVIVTARLQDKLQAAFFSPPGLDGVVRAIDEALKGRRLHCEIGILTQSDPFQIIETTRTDRQYPESFFESELVSVLLSRFDPVDVTRITARVLRESPSGTKVESDFLDRFRLAQYQGYLWNADIGSLCVRLEKLYEDSSLAIRLTSRQDRKLSQKDAAAALDAMNVTLPEVFPRASLLGL